MLHFFGVVLRAVHASAVLFQDANALHERLDRLRGGLHAEVVGQPDQVHSLELPDELHELGVLPDRVPVRLKQPLQELLRNRVQARVQPLPLRALNAVVRPERLPVLNAERGLAVNGCERKVARLVRVQRRDNRFVLAHQLVYRLHDRIRILHLQCTTFAKIILNINNHQNRFFARC